MEKVLNKLIMKENFVDKDRDNYIYASLSQPPLKIVDKNESESELDFTVVCPTCENHVNYGTEIFMLSGDHYCIKEGCREKLLAKYK